MTEKHPQWLDWAQRLQAIAQTGMYYEPHIFDQERYEKVQGIAAEIIAAYTDGGITQIHAMFDAQAGHATPKIDVRGVVFHNNALLLVRENLDGGRWTLPGGWADIGDSPSEAAVREVYEETGYRTRAVKLLALYDRNRHDHPPIAFHTYKAFFLCELLDTQPATDYANQTGAAFMETGEAAFFGDNEIPDDLSVGRVTHAQIKHFFELYHNPAAPTDFD